MYQYNDAKTTNYEYNLNDSMQENQTVPNVMFDDTKNIHSVQIQEGGNMEDINGGHQTLPMYAIDGSVPQFEIADPLLRRNFVRKILYILLLQTLITLPIVGIVSLFADVHMHHYTYGAITCLLFFIFVVMYIFSEARRYSPMNIIALTFLTILIVARDCILSSLGYSKIVFLSRLMSIVQILAIVLYTKQNRFKFTIFNSIIFVLIIYVICCCLVILVMPVGHAITYSAETDAIYFVYDIYLMLSGHHGYNLQPHEHIFAATNIYADRPNLLWRILKFVIITPIVIIYRFLMACCLAEVC